MDLETYRVKHNLSYEELATQIKGVVYRRVAQRYALGAQWPRGEQLQAILKACPGVTIEDMHKRHLRWQRQQKSAA